MKMFAKHIFERRLLFESVFCGTVNKTLLSSFITLFNSVLVTWDPYESLDYSDERRHIYTGIPLDAYT